MKILLCVASARLAYGGPALSVTALSRNLAGAGVSAGLWCPDGSSAELPGGAPPDGLQCLSGTLEQALSAFGRPDAIHDNGLWWPHNHRIARYAYRDSIPRVVSPRGMLEPWARQHKPMRKAIAWHLYQHRDLLSAAALHATSAQEQANLVGLLPGASVSLIGNGLEIPDTSRLAFRQPHDPAAPRQALFLGRLHPVKGLPRLLAAWHRAAPQGWRLVLAGPDEQGHRGELEQEVARLGLGASVSFAGAVTGAAKDRLFAESQLFVLPSHSESFGMSVGEALAHGLPVVTTTNVPWPQIETNACGWRVEGSASALADALVQATAAPQADLAEMGRRGRQVILDEFGWEALTQRFIALYAGVLSSRSGLQAA